MTQEVLGNYLRAHRRRFGLSQRQLAMLVGYENGRAVGRHELSQDAPPLLGALGYEVVFEVPVGQLFAGFRSAISDAVARNLPALKSEIAQQRGTAIQEKMTWLMTHPLT
jgi:transcriptional regulator with XRE-family HTH domain